MATNKREVPLAHPGEIMNEEFIKPLEITVNALALALRVPANRLYSIVDGKRGIAPDTAFRLARYFGTTANFWINLQAHYDLESHRSEMEEKIEREVQPRT
jgi:addiction module HigA family antidote